MTLTRRGLIGGAGAGAGGLLLGGCDRFAASAPGRTLFELGRNANRTTQRLVTAPDALAPEFTLSEMSPIFRTNGTSNPGTPAYAALLEDGFANWRLAVDGLVARPLSLSLAQLRALPSRTQITRHDCVEGWSAIGQWTGVPLSLLLRAAGLSGRARYVVFHCADLFGDTPYYESIGMIDAFHPQTILAYGMNGRALEVGHGAPLRLRVERQLGYKQAKYVMRIQATDSLAGIGDGRGGYWEDSAGYQWYAGI